ncbi:hypothetical protein K8R78_02735 [bacterium]|nr:hypothetical protein [bacterium]
MDRLQLVALLAVVLLVTLVGCETGTGGTSSGEKTARSYEWARKIANEVRDAEMPDGVLCMADAFPIEADGLIEDNVEADWTFYYYDDGAAADYYDCLWVNVDASGETSFTTDTQIEAEDGLPVYNNGNVSGWITTMDAAVNEGSLDYNDRFFQISSGSVTFPEVDNVAGMIYFGDDGFAAAVVLNADTGEVLGVYFY